MNEITIILSIVTTVMTLTAILLTWYSVTLLRKLWAVASNIDETQNIINTFREHLKIVYELETFYGDETLKQLLQHANTASEALEQYEDMLTLFDSVEDFEEDFEEDEEEENIAHAS